MAGLKYRPPSFASLDNARLNDEMVAMLDQYMDHSLMSDEHKYVWSVQRYHVETESDEENENKTSKSSDIDEDDMEMDDGSSILSDMSGGSVTLASKT